MSDLIKLSGNSGKLFRPVTSNAESFDGPVETDEQVIVESFPLEWHPSSPEELKQIGSSGSVHVLSDLDIRDGDFVLFKENRYRVTDVRLIELFGISVYQIVQLEREYRG